MRADRKKAGTKADRKSRKNRGKRLPAILMMLVCLGSMSFPAFAASPINKFKVHFEADESFSGGMVPGVYADVNEMEEADHFTVGEIVPSRYAGDAFGSGEIGDDIFVVTLYAEDGYHFASTKAEDIRLFGLGAELISATRKNFNEMMILRVRFNEVLDFVEEVGQADWAGGCRGRWQEAEGAKSYSVSLKTPSGQTYQAETCGTSYDFAPWMKSEGSYAYTVRPMSASGRKGAPVESPAIYVSAESAAANAAQYAVEKEVSFQNGFVGPGSQVVEYHNIGWKTSADGRLWYQNRDGSYIQENWLNDNGSWYYFGADGYMLKDTYRTVWSKDYYFGTDGKMAVLTATPDGRMAGEDGALAAR